MKKLYPFQIVGKDFLASRRNAILADDMGLGKTIQFIEAAKTIKAHNAIIVCPLGVRRSWVKTLRDQHPTVFIKEITSSKQLPDTTAFNIINYDNVWREPFFKEAMRHSWKLLGCDEAHFLKSIPSKSKRTKAILGMHGLYNKCEYRWMMTGTPVLNRPVELYPMLRALAPEILGPYTDFYKFAFKFCGAYQDTFGFNTSGASALPELAKILKPLMIRRLKEEVLPDLPDITYEKVYLDPTDKLMALTRQEKAEQDKQLSQISSIRRALGTIKLAAAIEHLEDLVLMKPKVICFTWHKDVAAGLKNHFKDKAVLYTGEESISEKERAKDAFIQNNGVQLFVGQLKAAGVGLDGLQAVCDTVVFVEMSYVPGEILQACDRIRRIGQDRRVLAQFLIAEDSMDEELVDSLTEKSKNIKTILEEKGDYAFISSECQVCRKPYEMKKLRRVAKLTVCKECENLMECLV